MVGAGEAGASSHANIQFFDFQYLLTREWWPRGTLTQKGVVRGEVIHVLTSSLCSLVKDITQGLNGCKFSLLLRDKTWECRTMPNERG